MKIEKVLSLIKSDMKAVEKTLIKQIDSKVPLINDVVAYLINSGGKRLRPLLLLLSAKLKNDLINDDCITLSVIIEYLHSATLLHDDVIDGAKYRRKKITANNKYGNDITVLCGDFLYSRSYIMLTEINDKKIQQTLSKTALIMSEGEVFQLLKNAKPDINIAFKDYEKIIYSKTAVLFSAACCVGARAVKMSESEVEKLSLFGEKLGIAFQMRDDMLDYLGNEKITGKKNGTDLSEGKVTLPLILLRDEVNSAEMKVIKNIIKKDIKNIDDLATIQSLLKKYFIDEKANKKIEKLVLKAINSLSIFPETDYKNALISLSNYLIAREN